MNDMRLYEKGIESASLTQIIIENVLILGMLISGSVLIYPLQVSGIPILTVSYVLFTGIMLGYVLRKHLCTHCYYFGKRCHCGWGKFAALIAEKECGNQKLGGTLGAITWVIIMIGPVLIFSGGAFFDLTDFSKQRYELITFILFLIMNIILHKKSCESCKMRYTCPGSAAKKNENN